MGLLKRTPAGEWERTCSRCGRVWYVTAAERAMRPPNAMTVRGVKMNAAGNRMKLVGGKKKAMVAEQRLARLQDQADTVDRVNRCPDCGSRACTERVAR